MITDKKELKCSDFSLNCLQNYATNQANMLDFSIITPSTNTLKLLGTVALVSTSIGFSYAYYNHHNTKYLPNLGNQLIAIVPQERGALENASDIALTLLADHSEIVTEIATEIVEDLINICIEASESAAYEVTNTYLIRVNSQLLSENISLRNKLSKVDELTDHAYKGIKSLQDNYKKLEVENSNLKREIIDLKDIKDSIEDQSSDDEQSSETSELPQGIDLQTDLNLEITGATDTLYSLDQSTL